MRSDRCLAVGVLAALLATGLPAFGQAFRRGGNEFNAIREVAAPAGKSYSILVTEFFHHGEISADGRNVAVMARNSQYAPHRLLQLGPGDYCRLAIQTIPGQSVYEILYGGAPVSQDATPAWTCRDGLLLQTRHYKDCDLNRLESVRAAFESAAPLGADYVAGVMHSHNPFLPVPSPFLTRYSGVMHIDKAGRYGFMISTQDCGFLLIDGRVITSAPGRHPPPRRVRPGMRADVRLTAGPHDFEFYHAASGPAAMMVAAWEVNPKSEDKPQPESIPSEVWRTSAVGRVAAQPVMTKTNRVSPDFLVKMAGEVPLPDNDVPLIGVSFKDITPKTLTSKAKIQWDFGDGQTSDQPDPMHVYLRPGIYTVKLSVARPPKHLEISNRVYVHRPFVTRTEKEHPLDAYLPMLVRYDPRKLDGPSVRQLVAVFEAKSASLEAGLQEADVMGDSASKSGETAAEIAARWADASKFAARAVEVGKAALGGEAAASGDDELIRVARTVGTLARDRIGQSKTAFEIWQGAAAKLKTPDLTAECAIHAADVAVNDLVQPAAAKPLLESAVAQLRQKTGPVAAMLKRVWGDYYAATGDGPAARKAYREAEELAKSNKRFTERTAWRGAYNRSTEDFLKMAAYDRAAREIRAWEREFPTEKIDGQLTLMYARYWAGRQMHAQVVGLSEQLLNVNRDSPCVDQVLLLAAQSELKRGKPDASLATLHALVKDYPGSPLVPAAKEQIKKLESSVRQPSKKPGK